MANANTPGFSRKRPVLIPGDPVVLGRLSVGTGVQLQKIENLRDPILELRLNQQTQNHSELDAALGALQQIEVGFSGTNSGIGDAITKFFDSLQQLSTDPTNLSLRQAVLTAAGNRNTALNAAAFLMGGYIAGGSILRNEVEAALALAAYRCGLGDEE